MKTKILTFSMTAIGLLAFSSCGDFLEESSQDEVKATTVEDLRAMMYSEAYPYTTVTPDSYLRLLTDEVQCSGLQNNNYATLLQYGQPVFTFMPTMFDGIEAFGTNANTWSNAYEKIKGCNAVLDYVGKMKGSEKDKQAMRAQCYFLRGMYYLRLALVYCLPYSNTTTTDPDVALGVPLQLTSEVTDEQKSRTTLRQTFTQIESDLLTSVDMLNEYYPDGLIPFRVSPTAAYILLSRMYLYMGDYAKSASYATLAIEDGPNLTNFSTLMNTYGYATYRVYDVANSSEVVFTYGTDSYKDGVYFASEYYQGTPPWTASSSLIALYDATNDYRYKDFYDSYSGVILKTSTYHSGSYGDMGLRMAEVYLNRAESNMRLYMAGGNAELRTSAITDINTLRKNRYKAGSSYEVDETLKDEELLQFILDERQRELCWENGIRWFDIKRLGLSVTHTYIDADNNTSTHTLEANSKLYALPIPYDAIDRNGNLEQNPR